MADANAHLEQSKSNEAAARFVKARYPDWAITMCFYAALHWVEYYAVMHGATTSKPGVERHQATMAYVKSIANNLRNAELSKAYDDLYDDSLSTRYVKRTDRQSAIAYFKFASNRVNSAFNKLALVKSILEA